MIKNYFLLFVRNIQRQKLFSFINLIGLTAGMVSTLLIYLYVQRELSYDRFHKNAENIYRINQTFIWGDHDENQFASLGPGVAYAIRSDIPEAKEVVRIQPPGDFLVVNAENKNDIKTFDEKEILAVDSNFFKVFTFPLIKGNEATALTKPASIVLTEKAAIKYFGTTDALGKLLKLGEGEKSFMCAVTGVAKNVPENSYINFEILLSMSTFPQVANGNNRWYWTTFETYVLLDKRSSPETLKAKLEPLPRKYGGPFLERVTGQSFDDYLKSGKKWELFVQPFTSIRLHSSNVYNRLNDVGNLKIVYVLIGVMVFIVLLSCINFMNLSTAQYTRRIKESSLRKILGSSQSQLALHFFSEAFLFCCIAAVIGFGLTQIAIPFYNMLAGTHLKFNVSENPQIIFVLLGLIALMSLLSGSYPAVFLSKFSPVETMKGKLRTGKQGKLLRNGLVTFQFFISMILIVSTIVVFQQIKFLAQKDIGFNRENLMVIDRVEWVNDTETFQHELKNIKGVEQVAWSTSVPPNLYDGDGFKVEGISDRTMNLNYCKVDEEYVPTMQLEIKVGRNFSKDIPADEHRIILNETAVKSFGWNVDENVLGKKIQYDDSTFEVVGIVRDFNYWALQAPIQPAAIFHKKSASMYSGQPNRYMILRVKPNDTEQLKSLIADVNKSWNKFAGDHPFQYSFVDDSFDQSFQSEEKFSQGLMLFAGLAIMIASFGLLGMIIYALEQRTKEIGIRKVVGASVATIWLLMIREYTYLILIAIVLSVPLSVWLLNNWLEDFNYRITISPMAYVIAGGGILLSALLVTSYHVLKAANTNPVDVLKDE